VHTIENASIFPAEWRKSSYSGAENECVEVADAIGSGGVYLRDSKNPAGPAHSFGTKEWAAFLEAVKAGEFEMI
jgi:hypothetical protein